VAKRGGGGGGGAPSAAVFGGGMRGSPDSRPPTSAASIVPAFAAVYKYGKYLVRPLARLAFGSTRTFKLQGQRVGERAFRRAQAGATVTQLPGTKRVTVGKKPPARTGAPGVAGPIKTGAGYAVGATVVQQVITQAPPLISGSVQAIQAYRAAGVPRVSGPTRRFSAQGNPYLGQIQRWGGPLPTSPPGYRDPVTGRPMVTAFGDPRAALERMRADAAKAEADRRITRASLYVPKITAKALPTPAKAAPVAWYAKAYGPLKSVGLGGLYPLIPGAVKLSPALAPLLRSRSQGSPKKRAGLTDSNLPSVGSILNPQQAPVVQQALQPMTAAAGKKCKPCAAKKRKKAGPRKLRAICYKGSYTETAKGLSKRKREQVPCR
jgi:hypothetical protein